MALLYEELTHKIRGALFEVYNTLGPGFKEDVYHNALIIEFMLRKIPFQSKSVQKVYYKGKVVGEYEPDFILYDKIVLEIKAVVEMSEVFEAQLLSYLKVTGYKLGLLVNFGGKEIDVKRRVM
ncbi:MAG: GxxExxY protein [Nitrospirota bacterium]